PPAAENQEAQYHQAAAALRPYRVARSRREGEAAGAAAASDRQGSCRRGRTDREREEGDGRQVSASRRFAFEPAGHGRGCKSPGGEKEEGDGRQAGAAADCRRGAQRRNPKGISLKARPQLDAALLGG